MYYQFDDYSVDQEKRMLVRNGELISNDEKSINLIAMLCANYPEVVDKQQLIEKLWPDQVVTDWSLSKLVSDVRQLLGDSGKDQGYIKTIRGKGFRFTCEVTEALLPHTPTATRANGAKYKKQSLALVMVVFVVLSIVGYNHFSSSISDYPYPLRIAVLPVQSESSNLVDDWVKYGIMSMASEQLDRYDSIQTLPVATVISSTTDLAAIDKNNVNDERAYYSGLCEKIGCTHVVAIRHKVESQQNSVLSYQIYSNNNRSPISEFVQPDVFDAAAMMLDYLVADLIPDEKQYHPLQETFSSDQKANRDYAIGVYELLSGDIKAAKDYLQLALKRQPNFFWANARLAEVDYRAGDLTSARKRIAKLSSFEHISGDQPDSNDSSLSTRESHKSRTSDNALQSSRRYYLQHLRSNVLYSEGKLDESLQISLQLLNNHHAMDDPLLMGNELLNVGSSYQASGDLQLATDYLEQAKLKYQQANFAVGEGKVLFNLGNVYLVSSRKEEAIESYQQAREIFIRFEMTGYSLMAKHQIASTSIFLGKIQFAEVELRMLIDRYKELGDLEGELTAKLDLVDVSVAKSDIVEAINRVEVVLPQVESSELSYIKNHARRLATVVYLKSNQIEMAEKYFNLFEGGWVDKRPDFAFVPAHIMLLRGELAEALALARELKSTMDKDWTEKHQTILSQFEKAFNEGKIIALNY
ncbi:MAG: winged helix-turn-helix domain-containing protein [Kangiellaceae bacterium]|nr:winged helix-turn-helix domain-containing protein [Kangiellaceae bacterium]